MYVHVPLLYQRLEFVDLEDIQLVYNESIICH